LVHNIEYKKISLLYDENNHRDNCGFGLVVHMNGAPSHWLTHIAIKALLRLTHRGTAATDDTSGDSRGFLMMKPDDFLRVICDEEGVNRNPQYGAGMVFLSYDDGLAAEARHRLETEQKTQVYGQAAWQQMPIDLQVGEPRVPSTLCAQSYS